MHAAIPPLCYMLQRQLYFCLQSITYEHSNNETLSYLSNSFFMYCFIYLEQVTCKLVSFYCTVKEERYLHCGFTQQDWQSLYSPTNALNKIQENINHKIQSMTSITPLHVLALKCILRNTPRTGVQAQHVNLGTD
jgi:hypothetical protein